MLKRLIKRFSTRADALLVGGDFTSAKELYHSEIDFLNRTSRSYIDKLHLLKKLAACEYKLGDMTAVEHILKKSIQLIKYCEIHEEITPNIVEAQKQTYEELIVLYLHQSPDMALELGRKLIRLSYDAEFIRVMKFYCLTASVMCGELNRAKNYFHTILDDVTDNMSLGMLYNNAGIAYWWDELEIEPHSPAETISDLFEISEINYILNMFENSVHYFEKQYFELKKDLDPNYDKDFAITDERIRLLLYKPTSYREIKEQLKVTSVLDVFKNPLSSIPLLNLAEIFLPNNNKVIKEHGMLCLHAAFTLLQSNMKLIRSEGLHSSNRLQSYFTNYADKYRSSYIKALSLLAEYAENDVI